MVLALICMKEVPLARICRCRWQFVREQLPAVRTTISVRCGGSGGCGVGERDARHRYGVTFTCSRAVIIVVVVIIIIVVVDSSTAPFAGISGQIVNQLLRRRRRRWRRQQ